MVVVGNGSYSVRLIDAVSGETFPEYTKVDTCDIEYKCNSRNNETFVEVQAEQEYFVQVQVLGGPLRKKVCFQLVIDDGFRLESRSITNRKVGPVLLGLLSRKNGIIHRTSFRFQSPQQNCKWRSAAVSAMGSVTVRISEAVHAGMENIVEDYKEDFSGYCSFDASGCGEGELLRSTEGDVTKSSTQSVKTPPRKRKRDRGVSYLPGRLLEEVTIHYSTKLGLIYARVVPLPSLWEFHRLKYGLSAEQQQDQSHFPCKRIKVDAEYDGTGEMTRPPREVELFDLTTIPTKSDTSYSDKRASIHRNTRIIDSEREIGSSNDDESIPSLIAS